MKPAITVELTAEPRSLGAARLDEFRVGVIVRNLGRQVVDPQLRLSELRVDGAPSQAWSMAVNNSGQDARWKALPPGESASARWPLARELFPRPGRYRLEVTVSGVTSAPVQVEVTP
jgi:hypothetical protein